MLDAPGRTEPWKVFWGCPIIGKSIATHDRALGHIMRPKLQIPFNVYGIMAITRPSILVLLPLSLPVIHKHSSSGYIQKMVSKQMPTFRENLNSQEHRIFITRLIV